MFQFNQDDVVVVSGVSAPGFNGKMAVVIEEAPNGRFVVELLDGSKLSLKGVNLIRKVKFVGLSNASLNGVEGHILGMNTDNTRVIVKVDDERTVAVNPDKLVDVAVHSGSTCYSGPGMSGLCDMLNGDVDLNNVASAVNGFLEKARARA